MVALIMNAVKGIMQPVSALLISPTRMVRTLTPCPRCCIAHARQVLLHCLRCIDMLMLNRDPMYLMQVGIEAQLDTSFLSVPGRASLCSLADRDGLAQDVRVKIR